MKTICMPKDLAEAWLAGLRSGEFEQATGVLQCTNKNGDGLAYCCLGVLEKMVDDKVEKYSFGAVCGLPSYPWLRRNKIKFLDSDGTEDRAPFLSILKMQAHSANDSGEYDFNKIADAIEADLEVTE
jgi:hypothetical protein